MSEDLEGDPVEDALLQMGLFDEREAAIMRAEAAGAVAEVSEISSAKKDAIIAASLRAAAPESEAPDSASSSTQSRRWIPWACGVAVAVAAVLVLWPAPPSRDAAAVREGPLPPSTFRLGGTARTLGDTPAVRAYGPGDAFLAELSFQSPVPFAVFADLFARDAEGAMHRVPLSSQRRESAVVFEGEIAEILSPGSWTLQVRYSGAHSCSASTSDGCESLETRIEVVGP